MATDNSAGAIFIDLGLDISQLESDFISANQTIQQNLNRLNRERNIIDLRAQVEIGGMDETVDATQILETRQRSLNQQLSMQRDRIRLTDAAFRQLSNTQGESAAATQNMAARLRREQLSLQRLEQQLQRVTAAQSDLATSSQTAAQSSYVNANQTVQQNLNRLSRESNLTDLRAQVEIGGLDETADQTRILEIRQRALTEQLNIQRARIQLVSAAHRQLADSQGAASSAAQDMEARLQREQVSLQRLEQQIQSLNRTQASTASGSNNTANAFVSVGLDISQLESGFVDARQTIQENLNRLNRERNIIDLRAQVEIGGLDETANAEQILETRIQSLNQQIQIQRDRVRLTDAAFRQLQNSQGANAAETREMEGNLRREQLSLQRLEQQLNSVTTAQENLNKSTTSGGESAESAGLEFGGLDSILEKLPPQVKLAVAGFTALSGAIIAVGTATNDLIERWRELQTQSYNFNLSVNNMETLARRVKFTGGEIEDLHGFLAGLNDAMTKGEWDDPEAIAMRWAGGNIFDPNGKLKKFDEQVEEIYRMYQKAKEAGQEIEFLQMMGGESGVTDAKQILDRWEEAGEDAEKIFDAGLDPEEFHKADRALRLSTEQMGEFKDAFENIVTPFSVAGFEKLFEVIHDGTEFLVENKDTIQSWGFIAIETFSTVADKLKALKAVYDELPNMGLMDLAQNNLPEELFQFGGLNVLGKTKDALFNDILERAQEKQDKYNGKVEEGTKSWADFRREQEKGIESTKESTAATKDATDALSQYNYAREVALRDELEGVKLENQHFKHGHDLELAQLDLERELNLRQLAMSESEKLAVEDLYAEKRKNIQLQLEDELDDLRDEATEEFKTDLENRMIEIENFKDDWIDAGMEEAEAEKYAQALKAKAIEDLNDEIAASLDSIWKNSLEQRLAEIEREKQAWIDKGVEEVKATQWAEQQKVNAQRNAAMEILKSQLEEYRAFQKGGYAGLKQYQLDKLYDAGITSKDLQMTPQQLADFQKAQQIAQNSLLKNFMTDTDKQLENLFSDYSFGQNQKYLLDKFVEEQDNLRQKHEMLGTKLIIGDKDFTDETLKEIYGLLPADELAQKVESVENSLSKYAQTLEDAIGDVTPSYTLDNTPQGLPEMDISGVDSAIQSLTPTIDTVKSDFETLPPVINDVESYFNDLTATTSDISNSFDELSPQIQDATSAFIDLISALKSATSATNNQQNTSTTNNVTNNVSIQEAHAWDYSHIRELAEKVADVITPQILSAIGGNFNGY